MRIEGSADDILFDLDEVIGDALGDFDSCALDDERDFAAVHAHVLMAVMRWMKENNRDHKRTDSGNVQG